MTRGVEEDGFAIVPGVLPIDEVRAAREHIDQLKPIHWDRLGPTDHFKNVFNQDTFFLQFIDRAPIIDLAESVMTSECHIIGETAWRSHPGHDGSGIHIDDLHATIDEELLTSGRVKMPVYLCTAHYYLSDITEEMCPTKVIAGSHKSGRAPEKGETSWNGRELETVLCKAGDVLFFRCEVWHSGSLNATKDKVRYLLQVHYGRRQVAQHFSPFLVWQFHPDVLALANPRQRRLLGDHKQMAYD
jgi:ectoine hydroxylase-related dioxygenase (phytanoyl-CoA dioxygenase family)